MTGLEWVTQHDITTQGYISNASAHRGSGNEVTLFANQYTVQDATWRGLWKCHSFMLPWYLMSTDWAPSAASGLEDLRPPDNS